jgi:hypothetical protein
VRRGRQQGGGSGGLEGWATTWRCSASPGGSPGGDSGVGRCRTATHCFHVRGGVHGILSSSPAAAVQGRGRECVWRVRGAALMLREKRGGQGWRRASGRRVAVARTGGHARAWPCRSCRARTSRARAGLGSVVHLSTHGAYELAQGTKGIHWDTVAGSGGER